jgi:hypothetical protein
MLQGKQKDSERHYLQQRHRWLVLCAV